MIGTNLATASPRMQKAIPERRGEQEVVPPVSTEAMIEHLRAVLPLSCRVLSDIESGDAKRWQAHARVTGVTALFW